MMASAEPHRSQKSAVGDLPVTVYSSESLVRHPARLVNEVCSDIWRCRELIWILFTRDLKAQFRQSIFGYLWLFVPIIATTLVWMFLSSMQVIQVVDTGIPYPVYVLLGSLIWGVFAASVTQPLSSFHDSRSVFTRLNVPPEAFILSGVAKVAFELLVKMCVLIPAIAFLGVTPAATAWLFPVGMACTVIVGLSVGLILVPIGSLYSDVSRAVTTLLSFGMYSAPVVFPPPKSGWTAAVVGNNPLTAMVMTSRDWLTVGHSEYLPMMVGTLIAAILLLVFGLIVLRVVLPHLVERMGM